MGKKKAIMSFRGVALAPVTANTVLAYATAAAFAIPYAGAMNRTAKERNGELYYDDKLYKMINEILGEEIEARFAEVALDLLETLGLGTFDQASNKLEANFGVENKSYALRCVTDTADKVPFYFNWRVFDLTSIRFDNFKTMDTGVQVCEVIIKGICMKPEHPTLKPWAIMQLKDDKSNQAACDAFMANGESYAGATTPVITLTGQPAHTGVTVGSITEELSVAASVTLSATLSYKWYRNTTLSNTGGTEISGATAATFAIPTDLTAGTYYYYCVVSATGGAASVISNPAVVIATA